jgi:scyllo-inositol 2-dehydrogenase (NADP+)
MIEVGVIGYGFAGKVFHAPVISAVDGLRLSAILRRSGASDPRYPDTAFVRSIEELLSRKLDLVVVCTPNVSHHELAKKCLLAGCHVVVDKPFTTTMAEAEDLIAVARQAGRLLSVYHNRRYVGDFRTVQKLLAQQELGRVAIYESHFDRFRPGLKADAWRERAEPGAGVWFDLGPHLLDQAMVLFGTPEAITADIRIEREGAEVDDAFDVTLHYPRMRAVLRATMLAASVGPTVAIHGTGGSYVKYGLDPQEEALKTGRSPREADWDAEPPEMYGTLTTADGARRVPTMRASFTEYYENVRDAIRGEARLAVLPEEALNVMRALELALESSRERKTKEFVI